jgi:hypothetical protein
VEWISKTQEGTRHAVEGHRTRHRDGDLEWWWLASTACGRTILGHSGGCVPALIDCGTCQRALRAAGDLS